MRSRTTFTFAALLAALALTGLAAMLSGCGSGAPSTGGSNSLAALSNSGGAAELTFAAEFPDVGARLIPVATGKIVIGVLDKTQWDAGKWIQFGFVVLTKDKPTGVLGGLPENTKCLIIAAAFPAVATDNPPPNDPNLTPQQKLDMMLGGALAYGTLEQTTPATGQSTPVELTMNSTVDKIDVQPATFSMGVNDGKRFLAAALDAKGRLVLVPPDKWQWTSSDPTVAKIVATSQPPVTVSETGPPPINLGSWANVLALKEGGPVTITATYGEPSPPKTGTAQVTVAGQGGMTIKGKVVDASDPSKVVVGAQVTIFPKDAAPGTPPIQKVLTGQDGGYQMPSMPPGAYRMHAEIPLNPTPPYAPTDVPVDLPFDKGTISELIIVVTMVPGPTASKVAFVGVEPGSSQVPPGTQITFKATVKDGAGNVLNLVPTWVTVGGIGVVDAAGNFKAVPNDAEGDVLAIVGKWVGRGHVRVGNPMNQTPAVLIGKVFQPSTTTPTVAGAHVALLPPPPPGGGTPPPPLKEEETNADGSYRFDGVPPGLYVLHVDPPEGSNLGPTEIKFEVPPVPPGAPSPTIERLAFLPGKDLVIKELYINPAGNTVQPGATVQYSVTAKDGSGNTITLPLTANWSLLGGIGKLQPQFGVNSTFTAGPNNANGFIGASVGMTYRELAIQVGTGTPP